MFNVYKGLSCICYQTHELTEELFEELLPSRYEDFLDSSNGTKEEMANFLLNLEENGQFIGEIIAEKINDVYDFNVEYVRGADNDYLIVSDISEYLIESKIKAAFKKYNLPAPRFLQLIVRDEYDEVQWD